MNRTPRITLAAVAALAVGVAGGCSSAGGGTGKASGKLVADGTMNVAIAVDPGSLDPQKSLVNTNVIINALAYDTPVTLNSRNQLQPGVVQSWRSSGTNAYVLTVRKGVTCSDGAPMDAKTVADNLNYVADPKNANPFVGVTVPAGSKATADATDATVTVQLPAPSPFFMQNLVLLSLVCEKGLTNRKLLTSGSAGSGPYVVSQVVPGDRVVYTLRKGYAWGPPGATTNTARGIPSKVVVKVVQSMTTTANLLLNGQLNAALVQGTDQQRLKSSGLFSIGVSALNDEIFFDQTKGSPEADLDVRRALLMALDMGSLAAVDSGGAGTQATGLLSDPKICPGNTIKGNLPSFDLQGAKDLLTQDGWTASGGARTKAGKKLSVTLFYSSGLPPTSATAELMEAQWKKLGVSVSLVQKPADQQASGLLGGTADWDATLLPIGVSTAAQIVPFLSGPGPDKKGENFSHIDNAAYDSLIAKASTEAGTQGCPDWNAAESALFKNADVAPIATVPQLWWAKDARFNIMSGDTLSPTTLRLYAG
jgi:peptide/nickel transport system substrate-binding protein